jgi:hypothetical protein
MNRITTTGTLPSRPTATLASTRRHGRTDEGPLDAEYVIYRLEEAGRTLLALPSGGFGPRLRVSVWEIVRSSLEGYGWSAAQVHPSVPAARLITRMDEAMSWIALIPRDRYVLRRIVGARALVSPVTERHLYTWRRLGALLGADHKAVQRWYAQGIDMIVTALSSGRVIQSDAA